MKKHLEVVRIYGKVFRGEELGFWVDFRDMRDGYNFQSCFFPETNKRRLVRTLRKFGCRVPHRIYRAIG